MVGKVKNKKFNEIIAFLMGLLASNNVIYVMKIGNTYFNIAIIFSLIAFIILFVQNANKNIHEIFGVLKGPLKLYIASVVLSFVVSFIIFTGTEYSSSIGNCIISFILVLIELETVYLLKEHKKMIVVGLVTGVFVNICVNIYLYILFKQGQGSSFILYDIFDQNAYLKNIWMYRAHGLFLEVSYCAAFFAVCIPLVSYLIKDIYARLTIMLVIIFLMAISLTGNIINVMLSCAVSLIFIRNDNKNKLKNEFAYIKKILMFVFVVSVLIYLSGYINNILIENNVINKISLGLKDSSFQAEGNQERYTIIKQSMALIPKYIMGVGYGMSPAAMKLNYEDNVIIATTFNILVRNTLELGIFGIVAYINMLLCCGVRLFVKGEIWTGKYRIFAK